MKVIRLLLSLTVPLLFTVKKNQVTISFEVNYENHKEIFNGLSKVENFLVLNPTIYRIEVLSGNEEEFTILYDECLSQIPCITNSVYTAAFLLINTTESSSTRYEEIITYDCPWILTAFCLNEIFFQRMAIKNGIEKVFEIREP